MFLQNKLEDVCPLCSSYSYLECLDKDLLNDFNYSNMRNNSDTHLFLISLLLWEISKRKLKTKY